ncbi:F-box/WD-40 repeat-containing protein At3g52030 isoform X1 [Syzygium oleosum]|uniref:F-box/WD-40 repeat-containing protein At3g52030 isoform X1 n=1 Tax=Syzygium oleosum TaxID=219896 RepID=UPI0011D2ADD5|nr:F-box/WD-40 repeat-containing protein At3g52030 isoform X1 [Syzygium oleosum]
MTGPSLADGRPPTRKRSGGERTTSINSLDHDILCVVFSFLGPFDLAHCSSVCKFWNKIVNKSKLLQDLYHRQRGSYAHSSDMPALSQKPLRYHMREWAIAHHQSSLRVGHVEVDQWKGHSIGVNQCRMKMSSILTGVGDKVMRLWSAESYKCLGEYAIPHAVSLIDYDFDESKIVGLIGTRIGIWRRGGQRSIFPSREGTFPKGLCLRYLDPEAVVGCEDGTVRVFDMYSRKCSRIIRMHSAPVTCLSLSGEQLIFSGSSLGSITISGLSSDERVATLRPNDRIGIKTLCFNPCSNLVFAGCASGYASCWDLRKMGVLWERRVSPNVLYSLGHMQYDTSTIVVGGIDGVLRVLDQSTGELVSSYVMDQPVSSASSSSGGIEKRNGRRLSEDARIDNIPRAARPPIMCLAVGMKKVVTTHNGKQIRLWKFH